MGAHAPVGPVKHPPAHSKGLGWLSSAYSKGWSCQRPCSGKTPRICWRERPRPCQHRHLTFLFNCVLG